MTAPPLTFRLNPAATLPAKPRPGNVASHSTAPLAKINLPTSGNHRFALFQLHPQQVADAPLYLVAHGHAILVIHGYARAIRTFPCARQREFLQLEAQARAAMIVQAATVNREAAEAWERPLDPCRRPGRCLPPRGSTRRPHPAPLGALGEWRR